MDETQIRGSRLPFNQFNADQARHSDQGSSACARICASLAKLFIEGELDIDRDLSDCDKMRHFYTDAVRAVDAARANGGHSVEDACREAGIRHLKQKQAVEPGDLASELSVSSPCALCVTAFKLNGDNNRSLRSSPTGGTSVIFVSSRVLVFHDPHCGDTIQLEGLGIRTADAFESAVFAHMKRRGCETNLLEIIRCMADDMAPEERDRLTNVADYPNAGDR